jgi:hypothetical protein
MKKLISILFSLLILSATLVPIQALADDDLPTLKSISFKNAEIVGEFSPDVNEYDIVLTDNSITPTLKEKEINGDANLFVTCNYDDSMHQTGIVATLQYKDGSTIYTFNYANAKEYAINSNCNLASVDCYLGEIYPEINDKDTDYKLYIPSDLEEIDITALPQDVNAHCNALSTTTLKSGQNIKIPITVTASDSSTKIYSFEVKRLKKNSQQVKALLKSDDSVSLLDGEFFYQRPEFAVAIISVVAGILLLAIFTIIIKKITLVAHDDNEQEFFELN